MKRCLIACVALAILYGGCSDPGGVLDYAIDGASDLVDDAFEAKPSAAQVEAGGEFMVHLRKEEYNKAYAMLTKSSRASMSVDELSALWSEPVEKLGPYSKTVHESKIEFDEADSTFLFAYSMEFENGFRVYTFYVKADGQIDEFSAGEIAVRGGRMRTMRVPTVKAPE